MFVQCMMIFPRKVTKINKFILNFAAPLDDDDGPDSKRSKSDSPASVLTGTPPAGALTPGLAAGPAGTIPGANVMPGMPGVIPGMPGLARPPFGVVPG